MVFGDSTDFLLVFLEIALAAVFKYDIPISLESELVEAFDDVGVVEFIHEFYFFLCHLCICFSHIPHLFDGYDFLIFDFLTFKYICE